jgi:excisionase family DNA binding protein
MDSRITTKEVANQFAEAIQLLLEWLRQEMQGTSRYPAEGRLPSKGDVDSQALYQPDKLLKAQEVANVLQISRSLAYQMMRRGEIPTIQVGRAVRVRRQDLDTFILKNVEDNSTEW